MKKMFFTLCFFVSAFVAMANPVDNKDGDKTKQQSSDLCVAQQEKTRQDVMSCCSATILDFPIGDTTGDEMVEHRVSYCCSYCTVSQACEIVDAMVAVIVSVL